MQDYKLPAGLRDNFGPQATQKESVRHYLTGLFQRHHYTLIETSLLEYRDVFGPYELQAESLYRILEADGQDLVLRPDLTLPIARFLVTTNVSLPTSFAYVGEQFRRNRQLTGLYNQSTQAGIELVGFQSRRAELECLTVISELNRDLFNGRLLVELGQARLADLVLADLPASERQKEAIANRSFIAVMADQDEMFELMNSIAPEHLELQVQDPITAMGKVQNAGSVFLGRYASEPLGDYLAGPNHVLPTGGTARFASPLGVYDFVKRTQFLQYTEAALAGVVQEVADLARAEGLEAHARAVEARFKEED
ncbi:MAG: histidinol dehydrogenase [Limosilactobacillus fermentum]